MTAIKMSKMRRFASPNTNIWAQKWILHWVLWSNIETSILNHKMTINQWEMAVVVASHHVMTTQNWCFGLKMPLSWPERTWKITVNV